MAPDAGVTAAEKQPKTQFPTQRMSSNEESEGKQYQQILTVMAGNDFAGVNDKNKAK